MKHKFREKAKLYIFCLTYQTTEDDKDHDTPPDDSFTVDVTISHGGHSHDQEVYTGPVGHRVPVVKRQRISRVFQLRETFFT